MNHSQSVARSSRGSARAAYAKTRIGKQVNPTRTGDVLLRKLFGDFGGHVSPAATIPHGNTSKRVKRYGRNVLTLALPDGAPAYVRMLNGEIRKAVKA